MSTKLKRTTKETRITVGLDLSGEPRTIQTPHAFLTHMLTTLAKHAGFGLDVKAESRDGDDHHLVEDVALTLGRALRTAIGTTPRERLAHDVIPMDDALVGTYLDAGGRAYYEGKLPNTLFEHFLRSFAFEAGLTLHVKVMRGRDEHHVVEAAFKGVARCLRRALQPSATTASTKGEVEEDGS